MADRPVSEMTDHEKIEEIHRLVTEMADRLTFFTDDEREGLNHALVVRIDNMRHVRDVATSPEVREAAQKQLDALVSAATKLGL